MNAQANDDKWHRNCLFAWTQVEEEAAEMLQYLDTPAAINTGWARPAVPFPVLQHLPTVTREATDALAAWIAAAQQVYANLSPTVTRIEVMVLRGLAGRFVSDAGYFLEHAREHVGDQ